MKQISLLRHGEAPISKKGDLYRELSAKGEADLKNLAQKIKNQKISFDYILCSPVKRAKDSMEIILNSLSKEPEVGYTEELYSYNGNDLSKFVQFLSEEKHKILIVGHNPLISRIANSIVNSTDNILFSPAMFMQINLNTSMWHEYQENQAKDYLIIAP